MAGVIEQRYTSPLRYPGGKGKLAEFIKLFILENDLVGSEYVELYAGGAAVALALLYEDYASHVHINDLNRSVSTFWRMVLAETDELCQRVRSVPVTVDEWHRQRAIQTITKPPDIDLAFSTLFLNRTSRSGIIGGGVIGGFDQTGAWKIDARFNRDDLIRRIRKVARHRSRITITSSDAADYIRSQLPQINSGFVYLDPPYYVKGKGLYQDYYTDTDHVEISKLVEGIQQPWIVSYDAAAKIRELYSSFQMIEYDLSYSAQDRYRGTEFIFFGAGLRCPNVKSPANVPWKVVNKARLARLVTG